MTPIREYIRLLTEKQRRDQKAKRVLYHIGPRPAAPKPLSRPGEFGWRRYWLDQDIESGVFFSPNPFDIAQYHGVDGDVYAYKIPEWVIAKAGGIHRYDHGSEVLISADAWEEAGDEIEFLGKSMSQEALWDKIDSEGAERFGRKPGSRPGWMTDEEWERASTDKAVQSHISGLRSTKHPENAIRMMKPEERSVALSAFETIDAPSEKDHEIIDMIKRYMNESVLRECVRGILTEAAYGLSEFEKRGYGITIEDRGDTFEIRLHDVWPPERGYFGIISAMLGGDIDSGPCLGGYVVTWSSVEEGGWGPLLYDLAMEYATSKGSGLISDRQSVSYKANKVWDYYLANRSDVEMVQMDDLENRLTPGDENDNCTQTLAYERGVEGGGFWDEWGDMEETPWDPYGREVLEDSPLSKMGVWKGTSNIEKIKAMDRWIEL